MLINYLWSFVLFVLVTLALRQLLRRYFFAFIRAVVLALELFQLLLHLGLGQGNSQQV
jgi:hypothetical protein